MSEKFNKDFDDATNTQLKIEDNLKERQKAILAGTQTISVIL